MKSAAGSELRQPSERNALLHDFCLCMLFRPPPCLAGSAQSVAELSAFWHDALVCRMEVNFRIRLLGHQTKAIKPLSEEKAVAQGAEVLGEGVIFGIAAGLLLLEHWSSSKKEAAKHAKLEANFAENRARITAVRWADALVWS